MWHSLLLCENRMFRTAASYSRSPLMRYSRPRASWQPRADTPLTLSRVLLPPVKVSLRHKSKKKTREGKNLLCRPTFRTWQTALWDSLRVSLSLWAAVCMSAKSSGLVSLQPLSRQLWETNSNLDSLLTLLSSQPSSFRQQVGCDCNGYCLLWLLRRLHHD